MFDLRIPDGWTPEEWESRLNIGDYVTVGEYPFPVQVLDINYVDKTCALSGLSGNHAMEGLEYISEQEARAIMEEETAPQMDPKYTTTLHGTAGKYIVLHGTADGAATSR